MWNAVLVLMLVANLLIFVHELGHLLAAKWAGMPVTKFSIGFGPRIVGFRVGRTMYQLALIPLGGYVRIEGMTGTREERRAWPTGFAFQPLHARMVVIAAGVSANVILAGLIYAVLALDGGSGPLEPGFHVLTFEDGSTHRVWVPDDERARVTILEALIPNLPEMVETDLRGAVRMGAREVERNSRLIAESGKLLASGAIGLRQLSGPVEIARIGNQTLQMDLRTFLAFIAFLSLNLAILNFLPIPVLDGGHFFMLILEGLKGSPLPQAVTRYSTVAGATVIGFFMVFAFVNDILRLIGF